MSIIELYTQIKDSFLAKDAYNTYVINHPGAAYVQLGHLLAPQAFSSYEVNKLIEIIEQENLNVRKELTKRLASFLTGILDFNFYQDLEAINHIDPHIATRNTFVGYWTILSYLNLHENLIPSEFDYKNKFLHLLKRYPPYRLNLKFQDLQEAHFSYVEFENADFSFANLNRAVLLHAKITDSVFRNCDFLEANLNNADIQGSDFSFANMQEAKLIDAKLFQTTWHGANLSLADLSGADLRDSHLDQANLYHADLTLANLEGSRLRQSNLQKTNLTRANCSDCLLQEASFHQAILYESNFTKADIREAHLHIQTMVKANFRDAIIDEGVDGFLKRQGAIIK